MAFITFEIFCILWVWFTTQSNSVLVETHWILHSSRDFHRSEAYALLELGAHKLCGVTIPAALQCELRGVFTCFALLASSGREWEGLASEGDLEFSSHPALGLSAPCLAGACCARMITARVHPWSCGDHPQLLTIWGLSTFKARVIFSPFPPSPRSVRAGAGGLIPSLVPTVGDAWVMGHAGPVGHAEGNVELASTAAIFQIWF